MTAEKAMLLMNMFLANDATDEEAKELFVHLSESAQSRILFTRMKFVHEGLLKPIEREYPHSIDTNLSALGMQQKADPTLLPRPYSVRLSSTIFSGFVLCLIGIMIYTILSKTLLNYQTFDPRVVTYTNYFKAAGNTQSEKP
jgi:hypothetical protein